MSTKNARALLAGLLLGAAPSCIYVEERTAGLTESCATIPVDAGHGPQLPPAGLDAGAALPPPSTPSTSTDAAPRADALAPPAPDARPSGSPADAARPPDAGVEPPSAPTFTQLYTQYFANQSYASRCTGSGCHDVLPVGVDMRSKAAAFTSMEKLVDRARPAGSSILRTLRNTMPKPPAPKMTTAEIARVEAWIAAGAKDD
jgi:hypothetical protein